MNRLIDADALVKELEIWHRNALAEKAEINAFFSSNFIDVVNMMPTIDAEPQWIPCSERLPEEPFGCLVTVWDTDPVTMDEFENILPYFVGWDGEQWNDGEGLQCPFEVIAWMPLPKPYEVEDEKTD